MRRVTHPEAVETAAAILGPLARRDEPLGPRTTYRVGGGAAAFFVIEDPEGLGLVSDAVRASGIEILVLGKGSNMLVADRGFGGLCLVLGDHYATVDIEAENSRVRAGAAVAYPLLARRAAAVGLRGLEWAVGIPGTVGGAVAMNAGGHGAETSDRLVRARVAHLSAGTEEFLPRSALGLAYRHSSLASTDLVLEAEYAVSTGDASEALAEIDGIVRWRREHQPGGRNGGSVFSNPPGDAAGRLIEAAGLKGMRVGSAEVSEKHANFFQCDPGGSADDVRRLIDTVAELVRERTGVALELELRLIGYPP